MRGTIKKVVADRGFGFIKRGRGEEDVFFHLSVVEDGGFDGLREGQAVEFELQDGTDRPRASFVSPR